jgi:hypothetical protein
MVSGRETLFLVAFAAARVPDSAGGVDEGVNVFTGAERQLENAEVPVNLGDRVCRWRITHFAQLAPARAGFVLLDSIYGVSNALRRLRLKAIVTVLVPVENQIDASVVEDIPQSLHSRGGAVRAGAEERPVEVG